MSKTVVNAPWMTCERCDSKFCFEFMENIDEGDIYYCIYCNHMKLDRVKE
jgi:DNA-directed RNA polymerase subunit RPC12/RpoP